MVEAYALQVRALLDGGADIIMVETIFDTLNAKAALYAIDIVFDDPDYEPVPLFVSGTIVDQSGKQISSSYHYSQGRTLSGQTGEGFISSVIHSNPLAIGKLQSFIADQMLPFMHRISKTTPTFTICYPNAGLPNTFGGYDQTPKEMAEQVREFVRLGLINVLGGKPCI